jgi:hypothetical protein
MRALLIFGACGIVLSVLGGGAVGRHYWDKANVQVMARAYPDKEAVASCSPNVPVMIAVTNASTQPIVQLEMNLVATQPGRTINFLQDGYATIVVPLEPGDDYYVCYSFALQPGAPADLVYGISRLDVTFR